MRFTCCRCWSASTAPLAEATALLDWRLAPVWQQAGAELAKQGSDGALDQDLEELMPEGPQRTRLDWKDLGKFAPDVDEPRTAPLPADRATLRRRGRVSSGRGYLRPPLPVDTVARIVELRDAGLNFKKIGKALGIAAWTVSRYVRSFQEGGR